MALGAQRTSVLAMILQSAFKLILIGTFAGLLVSLALTGILKSMIWGVSPFDPLSFSLVILLILAVGLIACFVPAIRASRLDPMHALRYE